MDTQFLNRSNKKREKIFRDRVSKSIDKLLLALSAHKEYALTQDEMLEIRQSLLEAIVAKGKASADEVIKNPTDNPLMGEELTEFIFDKLKSK